MARYSESFKYEIMKRMMPLNNHSITMITRETGLSEPTLYNM